METEFVKFLQEVRAVNYCFANKKEYFKKAEEFDKAVYDNTDYIMCINAVFETETSDKTIEDSDAYTWYVPRDLEGVSNFTEGTYLLVQTKEKTAKVRMIGEVYKLEKQTHIKNLHPYSMVITSMEEERRKADFEKLYDVYFRKNRPFSTNDNYNSEMEAKFILGVIGNLPKNCEVLWLPTVDFGSENGCGFSVPVQIGKYKYSRTLPVILITNATRWNFDYQNGKMFIEYYLQTNYEEEPIQFLKNYTKPFGFDNIYRYLKDNPL